MECSQNTDNLQKLYFIFENKNDFLELYARYLSINRKELFKIRPHTKTSRCYFLCYHKISGI